jgi:hypothetical protein
MVPRFIVLISIIAIIVSILFGNETQAQNQQQLLEKAYKKHSKKLLTQFFDNWAKELLPATDSEINTLNERQREAYKVLRPYTKRKTLRKYFFGIQLNIKNANIQLFKVA